MKSVRNARFVVVGIAATILELIGEHASIARETQAIKLEAMQDDELRLILEIGSSILSRYCAYSKGAMEEIISHCDGSPYWCHFLARALVQGELESAGSVESFLHAPTPRLFGKEDAAGLLRALPTKADCRIYEEALRQITMEDTTTATILLCIAKRPESIVSTASVSNALEGENISKEDVIATIEGILRMSGSPFQERGRIRDIVSFSFVDPVFKRYILIRNAGLN